MEIHPERTGCSLSSRNGFCLWLDALHCPRARRGIGRLEVLGQSEWGCSARRVFAWAGVPFIPAALFMGGFVGRLRAFRRAGRALQLAAGAIMVVMGVAMITGHLTMFAIFMFETFAALGTIG